MRRRGIGAVAGVLALAMVALGGTAIADSASPDDTYIVVYKRGTDITNKVQIEEARGNDVSDAFRVALKGIVAELSPTDVARLNDDPGVLVVERDRKVSAFALGPRDSASQSWGLDRSDQRALPMNGRITSATNGFGVDAYIIDTGVRADHAEFGGRVTAGFSAINDGVGSNDCQGHGTHVAGTVAGSTYGLAPEATVIPVRVLDCGGSGTWSGVIAGINWTASNHPAGTPAVANMSLGGGYSESINQAVAGAVADGITFAVAAGNENSSACNVSPASAPSAITVGSSNSNDSRSYFSNYGSCVDIFAPGMGITSAWIGSPTDTNTISGTSMASPHVAGAAALLLSASRSLTPTQVASQINSSATTGVVTDPQVGTPNKLLFVGNPSTPNPVPDPGPLPEPPAPDPPANDAFSSSIALDLSGVSGTTVGATRESGEPEHVSSGAGAARSIWYRWTAPSDGTLELSTQGSDYDSLLAVYTGTAVSGLTGLAANDDVGGGALWSRVSLQVSAGTTYRIAVDGYQGRTGSVALSGTFTAGGTPPEPPPPPPEPPVDPPPEPPAPDRPVNDDFANATALDLGGAIGTSVNATHETGEPEHVRSGVGSLHSVWYRWTAPADGMLTLKTQGSGFDTLLAVYTGSSVSALSPVAANDDVSGALWSQVDLPVSAGTAYRVAVDGFNQASGAVNLSGTFVEISDPDPEEPAPELPEGVLTPTGDGFVLGSRGVAGEMSCALPDGAIESNDCDALVRLRTSAGSSRRSVTMDAGSSRVVSLPLTPRMRRQLLRLGRVSAEMTVITVEGRESYQVLLLSQRAAAARKRALASAAR